MFLSESLTQDLGWRKTSASDDIIVTGKKSSKNFCGKQMFGIIKLD